MHKKLNQEIISLIVRATQNAAIATYPFIARGTPNDADGAAVNTICETLNKADTLIDVKIGEGEKDNAPMLAFGQKLGKGDKVEFDIAVDPIDGTTNLSTGRSGSISTIAIAPKGSLLSIHDHYIIKLASFNVPSNQVMDINLPIEENIKNYSKYTGKQIDQIQIVALDRPYNSAVISAVRNIGAKIILIRDGDIHGVLSAGMTNKYDIFAGQGGATEGVIAAVAVKALGGFFEGKLLGSQKKLQLNDIVSQNGAFVATGITGEGKYTSFLKGVEKTDRGTFTTRTLVIHDYKVQKIKETSWM